MSDIPIEHRRMILSKMGISLNPWQVPILEADSSVRDITCITGNQAGKSFALSLMAAEYLSVPDKTVVILVPVLSLAKKQIFRYLHEYFVGPLKFLKPVIHKTRHNLDISVNHGSRGESRVDVFSLRHEDYLEDIVADLIICDELASCQSNHIDWLRTNVRSRLITRKGRLVSITTSKNKPWVRSYVDSFRKAAQKYDPEGKRLGENGRIYRGFDSMFIEHVSTLDNLVLDRNEILRVQRKLGVRVAEERLFGMEPAYTDLVWPSFSENNIQEVQYDLSWEMFWGIDLGFHDETVFFLAGYKDGRVHLFDGFKIGRRTPVTLAPMMQSVLKRYGLDKKSVQGYSDHNTQVYQCFNEPIEPYGFICKSAYKADKVESINHIDSMWSQGSLSIAPELHFLADDIFRYEYDEKERIRHQYSHSPDSCRYLVYSILCDRFKIDLDELSFPTISRNELNFGYNSKVEWNWR
jgi:hypothetical protein